MNVLLTEQVEMLEEIGKFHAVLDSKGQLKAEDLILHKSLKME